MRAHRPLAIDHREAAASVADLGTIVPILAALVLINGVDAGAALLFAGLLFVVAGVVYRIPTPVQPVKAAAAIAIATQAPPEVIAAAGMGLGAILVLLAATRLIDVVARLFPKPMIRGNQLGVGILLAVAAHGLVRGDTVSLAAGAVVVGALAAAGAHRGLVAAACVGGGIVWSLLDGGAMTTVPAAALPAMDVPSWASLATAMTLLVIPQIPLTLGNAVIGTADLQRDYHGARAARATPARLSLTSGLANVSLGFFGGVPLCHGSSGATAYHRFGARTGGVNLVLGGTLVAAGVFFAPSALALFALIPAPVLAGLLAYTGLRHATLVTDQRGPMLAIAVAMGIVGGATRNLMLGMAVGVPAYLIVTGARRALAGAVR